jgi:hypothetical protein
MAMQKRKPVGLRFCISGMKLLLGWVRLAARNVREDGAIAAGAARHRYREGNGREHEQDGRPSGEFGKQVSCSAGSESGLRTLAAEGTGEIRRFALLDQNYTDKEQADNNVKNDEQNNHGWSVAFRPRTAKI